MSKELKEYKSFIDELAERKASSVSSWVTGKGFPTIPGNEEKNALLSTLSNEQKNVLSKIIQESKESGIHDTLVYLNELMVSGELVLIKNGTKLPIEPFGTEMHFDWVARAEGDEWPK